MVQEFRSSGLPDVAFASVAWQLCVQAKSGVAGLPDVAFAFCSMAALYASEVGSSGVQESACRRMGVGRAVLVARFWEPRSTSPCSKMRLIGLMGLMGQILLVP